MNSHYYFALSSIKQGLWTLLCLIFLATGTQQERRDAIDLLEELLGMPRMREIEALARPSPPQQLEHLSNRRHSHSSPSYSGTTVRRSRSFQHYAEDRHHTLVVGRFRHLHRFLVLLLRGHLHPAINKDRLEYNGIGWGWGDSYTLLLCEWPLETVSTFIKAFVFWIEVNVYSAC